MTRRGRGPGARPRVLQQHRHADAARGPRSDHGGHRGSGGGAGRRATRARPPSAPSPASGRCRRWSITSWRPTGPGSTSCGASWPASGRPASPSRPRCSRRPRSLRPWSWLLDELRRVHRDVVEVLAAVPADVRDRRPGADRHGGERRRARRPACGPLHWVEDLEWKAYALVSWRLHAIDHMKQVRKVVAALRVARPRAQSRIQSSAGGSHGPAAAVEPDSAATSARRYRRCRLMPWR